MDRQVPISVIILYHEGLSYLKACLDSVLSTLNDFDEIIVVINNEDVAIHNIPITDDRILFVKYAENFGHAKAGNIGVSIAKNDHVVICDHDLVFSAGWLNSLWFFYTSDPNLGAVCCKVVDTLDNTVLDVGISFSDFNFAHPFMDLPHSHPLVCTNRTPQMICTGGFLIGKELFNRVGGFNEGFGTLYTDLDISLQIKKAGLKVGVCANAVACHFAGELFRKERNYKASFLKSDVKGAFMKKNAALLATDIQVYYTESAKYFVEKHGDFKKYFFCNMLNVANPAYYEQIIVSLGAKMYDKINRPSMDRDASSTRLFDLLGYDIMYLGVPILYFTDRFISLRSNFFWWHNRRRFIEDMVVDRHCNILPVKELISHQSKGKL